MPINQSIKIKNKNKHNLTFTRSLIQAEKKLESAKEEYEMITETLRKELERFEKTKGKEITKVMREFAKENMDTTVQVRFSSQTVATHFVGPAAFLLVSNSLLFVSTGC